MSSHTNSSPSSSPAAARDHDTSGQASLQLDGLPPIFVLPTHLSVDELENVENVLVTHGATVTYDISEASIALGAVSTVRRAKFELNTRNVAAEVFDPGNGPIDATEVRCTPEESDSILGKRKREHGRSTAYEDSTTDPDASRARKATWLTVVRLDWLNDSIKQQNPLDLHEYSVCIAKVTKPSWSVPKSSPYKSTTKVAAAGAKQDQVGLAADTHALAKHQGRTFSRQRRSQQLSTRPKLIRESTTEHDLGVHVQVPPTPAWVREGKVYACERVTPAESPNHDFLDLLEKIRLGRILIEDQIGVRAYSTSIASLAAYPHKFIDSREIGKLPGCDQKIEILFREYQSTRQIAASQAIDDDTALRVIRDFYNIWGVGAKTAREWYYERGWRDHDDIIQYGWNDLSRVQQIGLKFFEEFELKIPRAEVEAIASVVAEHAIALTDRRMTCTIVGGYRRGKTESGDVDIILSHPEEPVTHYFIHNLIVALEESGWITHTLTLSEANSQRDQQTLGLRVDSSKGGFDTLDKALLVWQDPNWPDKEQARAEDPNAKNPNVHRRVDIIISPWRTVGCAIAGWSSGTTFQRDLRRFAKHKYGWKFDSSGVRDRKTGRWVDLEKWSDPNTRATTPLEAEQRMFEGLGLEYREPWERCTR